MRTLKTVTSEIEEVESTTCDLCGAETKGYGWGKTCWEQTYVYVSMVKETNHQRTHSREMTSLDVCPECFVGEILPPNVKPQVMEEHG
jgi:hypothetical protein